MHSSNLYATDGLLILGVVLVCVTIYSGLRGLYVRSAAVVLTDEDLPGERLPVAPRRPTTLTPSPRRAA